jgi:thiamine kinase-like enzyme
MTDDLTPLLDRVPGWRGRATVVGPLDGGITNRNMLVDVDEERFVLRLAGKDTELLGIDRPRERAAQERAAGLGIAPDVVAFLEPEGYLITRFVPGIAIPVPEMGHRDTLRAVAPMLRSFHDSGPLAGAFDCFRIGLKSAAIARGKGVKIPDAYTNAAARGAQIERAFSRSREPPVPCHNDLLNANFLRDGNRIWLLDWEYAGMNERFFDLGNFSVNNELDEAAEEELLIAYFGASTPRRRARLALMKIMSDLREAMWGVVQQAISTIDFDYAAYAAKHFERLRANAAAPGFLALLEQAAISEVDDRA